VSRWHVDDFECRGECVAGLKIQSIPPECESPRSLSIPKASNWVSASCNEVGAVGAHRETGIRGVRRNKNALQLRQAAGIRLELSDLTRLINQVGG
jgi:hypothetical protein